MSIIANIRSAERIITGEITISGHLQKDYTNFFFSLGVTTH